MVARFLLLFFTLSLLHASTYGDDEVSRRIEDGLAIFSEQLPALKRSTTSPEEERQRIFNAAGIALCYTGAGYDHRTPNKYRKVCVDLIDVLLNAPVGDNGLICGDLGTHALATLAIAEYWALTWDSRLRMPLGLRMGLIISRCNQDGHWLDDEAAEDGLLATVLCGRAIRTTAAGGMNLAGPRARLKAWVVPELAATQPDGDPVCVGRLLMIGADTGHKVDDHVRLLLARQLVDPVTMIEALDPLDTWFWTSVAFAYDNSTWERYATPAQAVLFFRNDQDRKLARRETAIISRMWQDLLSLEVLYRYAPVNK